jgi:UDP-glucose 4-epimerase
VSGPVAVTGAGGYVGGRLVAHLRAAGRPVRPLARRAVPWEPGAALVDLALAPVDEVAAALDGCAAVVHLAGASEVVAARDPDGALAGTVAATRRVAAAAAAAGVDRVVDVSTVHVYGAALEAGGTVDEAVLPQPRHPYAVARLAGEHLAAAAGVGSLVVLRLTNSVGAPVDARVDRWSLVAMDLCAQAAAGGPLRLRSSGRQWRDFVDLGEVCGVLDAAAAGAVPAGTYNLGSGRATTVLELAGVVADAAEQLLGARPSIEAPEHAGALPAPVTVDVSALARHLPTPSAPLEGSVRELLQLCIAAGKVPAR